MEYLRFIITDINSNPIDIRLELTNGSLLKEDFEKIFEAYKNHKIIKITIED